MKLSSGDESLPLVSPRLELVGLEMVWGSRSYLMAILNITPDSFSGDGMLEGASGSTAVDRAIDHAARALSEGADILDVGGESTRPGSAPLDASAETERVVPVIEALKHRFDAPLSIDTYKSGVALEAIRAGADMVNDVWALRADPKMAALIAEMQVPIVLMHNRSTPKNLAISAALGGHFQGVDYDDLLADVRSELGASIELANRAGVAADRIIVDPGLGFGKTRRQNLELIDRCGQIRALGYPMLIGSSRKSFIGLTLDLPADQRLEGTAATVALAVARGADILRVHDVRAMSRVMRMSDAILRR